MIDDMIRTSFWRKAILATACLSIPLGLLVGYAHGCRTGIAAGLALCVAAGSIEFVLFRMVRPDGEKPEQKT